MNKLYLFILIETLTNKWNLRILKSKFIMKICNPKMHRQKFLGKGDEKCRRLKNTSLSTQLSSLKALN